VKYKTVIGLEVHVELKTKSKIFCGCSTEFGAAPNTNVCPVCLGLPGVLPVLNKAVVEFAIRAGLALNCQIAEYSKFDRKNYYYPDLPKNFQTSQFDLPIAEHGWLDIEVDGKTKRIGITRIHMEEDAGKLVHAGTITTSDITCVDYNRTGVPLIEIVSEPDLRSPEEAKAYMEKMRTILQYIDVSDCKMEEGSLRCDANISLRLADTEPFGIRAELKNLNSFRSVQRGLEYEQIRQAEILNDGGRVIQETRSFDEGKNVTLSLRSKEQADDYRYFPEPDLPPLVITKQLIDEIRAQLPELPDSRVARLIEQDGLSEYDAKVITATKAMAEYYDAVRVSVTDAKLVANWLTGELARLLNANAVEVEDCPIKAANIVGLLKLLEDGTISGKIAKTVIEEMWQSGKTAKQIVEEKGMVQISNVDEIVIIVEEVINANPQSVEDYRGGKEKAIGFLVGCVMKLSKGRAKPDLVNKLLKERL
jgi:aspartyl-tRNA(Asn)/glutamyl-tRNA(Gln) amidotransferase subunit B